ncbi:MAG: prepilin-type N-terminal cleavage/methylation domain-containing protein [Terriglobales bacterium]
MATAMMERGVKAGGRKEAESGFSLIEVMISMVILTVGLVSVLGVFGLAMAATQTSQLDMIAKQLANEAYESIVTARNTSQISWDAIQNSSGTQYCTTTPSPCGIFVGSADSPVYQPIYNSGADGIFGTADDANAGEETLEEPGPDGKYGDADDVKIPLTDFQRAIQITPLFDANNNLVPTLRSVTITMQYRAPQTRLQKTYVLNSFISEYR